MFVFISSLFFAIRVFFQDLGDVALEVLALRQAWHAHGPAGPMFS